MGKSAVNYCEIAYDELNKKEIGDYVIWGTGSAFQYINERINIESNAACFVETTPLYEHFHNKEVLSARVFFENTIYQGYTILICTNAWKRIVTDIGIEMFHGFKVINLYETKKQEIIKHTMPLSIHFDKINHFISTYQETIHQRVQKNNEKILIMIKEWTGSLIPYHQIVLGMLLKSKGASVEFLFNDQSLYGDIIMYEGAVKDQNDIIESVLKKIETITGIPYLKLSASCTGTLTDYEVEKLQIALYYNKVWHSKKVVFDKNDKELIRLEKNWFENAELIKGFLTNRDFEKIVSFTGAHFDWAILDKLSRAMGKKTYTFEYARGGFSFSRSGPTVLQKDVPLIEEHMITSEMKKELFDFANTHIAEKSLSNELIKDPLVLIPLNIFWDSASFGEEDAFLQFDQWLVSTIQHILDHHKVRVVVRQHPHENKYHTGKDVEELLLSTFGEHPLFEFIPARAPTNTYDLLKDAVLILPNTSTVGIEAAMIGKQVVVKNNVYYANTGFVRKALSKENYLAQISDCLDNPKGLSEDSMKKAKLYFALTMHNRVDKSFGQNENDFLQWVEDSFENISNYQSVQWLVDLIVNDKTLLMNYLESKSVKS